MIWVSTVYWLKMLVLLLAKTFMMEQWPASAARVVSLELLQQPVISLLLSRREYENST